MIMGADVEAEFVESVEGEVCAVEQFRGEFAEEANGGRDEWFPGARGDSDITDIQWQGAEAFVGVDFGAATVFEHGNGAIADVDIQLSECGGDGGWLSESAGFGADVEGGFEHFCQQKWAEEFVFGDVSEEIGVMQAEGREELIECEADDFFGLRAL
jgi:hypothetical protein